MSKAFGWAVIGAGAIAHTVAREITKTKRHRIVSVFSRTYERACAFAERYGATAYTSLDDALGAQGVEGVYIATPHTSHLEYATRAIELGVPALIEKPITMNASELESIMVMKRGSYVGEAMWTRYNPITLEVKRIVDSGAIGDIVSVSGEFSYPYFISGFSDRVVKREYGGGALLDIGVYLVSYMDMLFGEPIEIDADTRLNRYGTDKCTTMRFDYGSFSAHLVTALDRLSLCRMEIVGTRGSIKMPLFYRPTRAVVVVDGKRRVLRCKAGYIHEFDRVASDIRSGNTESEYITLDMSLSVMRTIDRVRDIIGLRYPSDSHI